MPTLADSFVMQAYADIVLDVHRLGSSFGAAQRRMQLEGAIRNAFRTCGVPEPAMTWGPGGGTFQWTTWTLDSDANAYTADPSTADLKFWLNAVTTQYHEARHCEQWWLMALGMLKGSVPVPAGAHGRSAMPLTATVNDRGQQLEKIFLYPQRILLQADSRKNSFLDSMIPLVRSWVDSVYGGARTSRGHTLKHLKHLGHKSMNPYIQLPEEADAWRVERELRRLLKRKIQERLGAQALEGLAGLFD
jgi:hypothetical protein